MNLPVAIGIAVAVEDAIVERRSDYCGDDDDVAAGADDFPCAVGHSFDCQFVAELVVGVSSVQVHAANAAFAVVRFHRNHRRPYPIRN